MGNLFTKDKGVTLVALVVSIIILLILAGVSLSMVMGDSSVINHASQANDRLTNSKIFEDLGYYATDYYVASRVGDYTGQIDDYFLEQEIIKKVDGEDNVYLVDVIKLTGAPDYPMGKGTDEVHDVYIMTLVDENYHKFEVTYNDYNDNLKLLGTISSKEIIVQVEGIGN